jgi:hypothetical protein
MLRSGVGGVQAEDKARNDLSEAARRSDDAQAQDGSKRNCVFRFPSATSVHEATAECTLVTAEKAILSFQAVVTEFVLVD